MRCIHCGQEIAPDSRFCATCGGTQPQYPPVPPRAQPKKKNDVLWIIAFVWLGIVALGWILMLLLMPNQAKTPAQAVQQVQSASLTEGTWYQWDVNRGKLYQWRFSGGVAEFGQAEGERNQQADYSVDSDGNVYIGIDADGLVWEKDSLENCYWQYVQAGDQICKIRIFSSDQIPAGSAACYTYRVDNGTAFVPVTYDNITTMDQATAEMLLRWYNQYTSFGVCPDAWEEVSDAEAQAVLKSADLMDIYVVYRVNCCNTLTQCREHVAHHLGDAIMDTEKHWECEPVEYDGKLYWIVAPMGYASLSIDGKVTEHGNGTWTAPLAFYAEGDRFGGYTATFAIEDGTIKLISVERD